MVTSVGIETDLVQLDFDAADAYQAAIDRLDNPERRATLARFRKDYLRHTAELNGALRRPGEVPPSGADVKSMLTQGKVVMAGLVGDEAIPRAMRTNEADTNTAYERAVQFPDVDAGIRESLEAALAYQRHHRAPILSQIE